MKRKKREERDMTQYYQKKKIIKLINLIAQDLIKILCRYDKELEGNHDRLEEYLTIDP